MRTRRCWPAPPRAPIRSCLFFCWLPYGAAPSGDSTAGGPAGGIGSGGGGGSGVERARDRSLYAIHPVPLTDVRSISKHTPALGQHRVTVTLASGVSLPPFAFLHVRRPGGRRLGRRVCVCQ